MLLDAVCMAVVPMLPHAAPKPTPAAMGVSSLAPTTTAGPNQAPAAVVDTAQLGVGAQAMLGADTMAAGAGTSAAMHACTLQVLSIRAHPCTYTYGDHTNVLILSPSVA